MEVVIAVALLALALTPLLGLFVSSRESAEEATRRGRASLLARSTMDQIIAQAPWSSILTTAPAPHPLDSDFTVAVTVTADRSDWLKDVTVRISWTDGGEGRYLDLYSAVYDREGGP